MHNIFFKCKNILLDNRELLLQGWNKLNRDDLAPNVALVSRRFNEVDKSKILLYFFEKQKRTENHLT